MWFWAGIRAKYLIKCGVGRGPGKIHDSIWCWAGIRAKYLIKCCVGRESGHPQNDQGDHGHVQTDPGEGCQEPHNKSFRQV